MRRDMVVSYVRDLLGSIVGERPEPDQDGDLPVPYLGAQFYVRIVGEDPVVQVFAVAVADVDASPELHAALNAINADLHFARAFHVASQVLVEHEIWGTDVNPANLEHACRHVASGADYYGKLLARDFGGRPVFEEQKQPDYEASSARVGYGQYL